MKNLFYCFVVALFVSAWPVVAAAQTADLTITKSGPATVTAGTNITYTVVVSNPAGPQHAPNVTVTDPLPPGTVFVSAAQTGGTNPGVFSCTAPSGTITCTAGQVAFGTSFTLTFVLTVNANTADGTTLTNTATVSIDPCCGTDPNLGNNTSSTSATVINQADLAVTKSGPATITAGNNITYNISLTNNGPSNAQSVTLTDTLPAGTTFVSETQNTGPSFTCNNPSVGGTGSVSCTIGTLTSGASATFTLIYKVGANVANGTTITNTASASSPTTDPTPGNNSQSTSATVNASADLAVTKSGPPTITAGNNITYNVSITNNGPSDAQSVTLSDTLPAGTTFVSEMQNTGPAFTCTNPSVGGTGSVSCTIATLANGASATLTLVYQVAVSTAGGTIITNTASASSATISDPTPGNNSQATSATVNSGGTLQFSSATYSVTENAGPATITITRTGGTAGTATVQFATSNGTATSADYTTVSQTVTFNDGDTSKTVSVPITDDLFNEPDETVNLTISNAGGSGQLGTPTTAVLTIVDDDPVGGYIRFSATNYNTTENSGFTTITVQRVGDLSRAVTVNYSTPDDSSAMTVLPCSTANGVASPRCDFTTALGTLKFASGETSKTFTVLINQDNFVEGPETLTLTLSNLTGGAGFDTPGATTATAMLTIADDVIEPSGNAIDDTDTFVRQHYRDFLNREADASGLAFWKDNIDKCNDSARRPVGLTAAQCIEVFRINTSAAFFLSIEFQNTGFYVERIYKAGFGDISPPTVPVPIRFTNFLRDTQEVGAGVIVGQGNWQIQLDNNKSAFALSFVQRPGFLSRYPGLTSATAFVDSLNANAGGVLSDSERSALISELSPNPSDPSLRADVLRKIADNATLQQREFNRAFVLMQYFGYLRRNPDAAAEQNLNFDGFNFWLNKLNQFNGNFINADMVKAFVNANEYRQRFGP